MKYLLTIFSLFLVAQTRAQQALQINHLTGNVYVFTTYKEYNGTAFPANGLYIVTGSGIVLVDMPWDTTQTLPLLDSIRARHHQEVVMSISTHFHDDRTAAIDILRQHGVRTYATAETKALCAREHNPLPEFVFARDTVFNIGGVVLQTFYPGAGHTHDNIVVWLPQAKVLYGGCFIKSMETNSIGNIADGDTKAWAKSTKKLMKAFPGAVYVVPGHQAWGGPEALQHTLDIVHAYNKSRH